MKVILDLPAISAGVVIELDGSWSPAMVNAIAASLPIKIKIERWGDELYSEPTPIRIGEENAVREVELFDVAYWPPGRALCFFYGPTPLSSGKKILPYSPVNLVGKIKEPPRDIASFLQAVQETHIKNRLPAVLR